MNDNFLHNIFPWIMYPLGVGMTICLHIAMQSWGIGLQISTYTPVFIAVGMLTLFELYFPNSKQWRPVFDDVKNDVIYMLVVQAFLPKVLAFLSALLLLRYTQNSGLPVSNYWPHHWPYWIQAIIMILTADFLRYWFHVACHKNSFLWRFHAVHHSPGKLYWVNTGRFHPIEKAAQFLFDALPFILLGISENVLAFYFVFYAVNGFFQHSNIKLKFGVLNYLISTAELHRFHHSRVESEANSNYGNNTIVWDLLFGTRYLPAGQNVEKLGLKNSKYPSGFFEQLKTPFIGGADKKVLPLPDFKELIVNGLIKLHMEITRHTVWKSLIDAAKNPGYAQNKFLKDVVDKNKHTRFGHESLDNITPADMYFGRYQEVIDRRAMIKQTTLQQRRRENLAMTGCH